MQKSIPSVGRILVMVGFALSCFGLLLFLWLAFGGPIPLQPKGYRFTVAFKEAGQLAQEADVRISGVSVGKVKTIETGPKTGLSDAVIELEERYAPIPRDTKAVLRQKTLLGETYVELSPGSRRGGAVAEGGRLAAGSVSPTVELDEIFQAFDEKTRRGFQTWMQELALASAGRGRDFSDAIGNLVPFATDANELLKILNAQAPTVQKLIRDTGVVFTALSERDGQLRSLIENSNRVFATTASRDEALKETFIALPTFERESTITVRRLADFAADTNPLVDQLRPAARQLGPTMVQLRGLAPDLNRLFRDLDPAITASELGLPALERFTDDLRPLLGELDPPLRQLNPLLQYVGENKNELASLFANSTAATQATAQNAAGQQIHYLRTTNPLNLENLAVYPRRLGSNRTNPHPFSRFYDELARGMTSYETRHCGSGTPTLLTDPPAAPVTTTTSGITSVLPTLPGLPAPTTATLVSDPTTVIPGPIADMLESYVRPGGGVPAPPCRQQPQRTWQGETGLFAHVKASTGATARAATTP